ncbi:bifunctional diguanylate cyclase/phosphodiesterase [Thiocapsa marina]|uniref:cyclic-guanylate-specific phosphodiesterase n=1 Tax=Thiocapsa marina 5811 TaxID=768671 RepID=F9UDV9_9GAMM|nr:EAL domain-containing protein [Thiocapsa marina]EGV17516.1 diguanylate cyclase/phosphodiesterase with PAS/PAC and Chase sensor(s) [Thiocapsa marina 5811]
MTHSSLRAAARPGVVAAVVFLTAAILGAAAIAYFEQQRLALARADAAALADDFADILEIQIDRALSVTYALAALVHQGEGRIDGFETTARALLPFYENVQALYLAPEGIVRQVSPLETNEAVLGLNLLEDPDQRTEARLARDTGRLTLAGPFALVQGGEGLVGRLPVFLEDAQGNPLFWGFTMAMLRTPSALAPAGLSQLHERGFEFALWRTDPSSGAVQIIERSSPATLADPVNQPVPLPNATWTLSVSPIRGWSDPAGLAFKGASAVSLALLLAALAGLLVKSKGDRERLEDLVRERTTQIRARESELTRAQAVAKVGSWTMDPASGRVQRSAETERILGPHEGQPCTTQALFGPVHPDDREITEQAWQAARAGEPFDICYRTLNGERLSWLRARLEPAPTASNGRGCSVGTLQDITEHRAADAALRESEAFLNSVMEILPVGIWFLNADGEIRFINEAGKRIWGGTRYVGFERFSEYKAWWLDSGKPIEPADWAATRAISRGETSLGEQIEIECFDGTRKIVLNSAVPLRGTDGAVTGVVVVNQDITRDKAAEEEIRRLAFFDPLTRLPNRRLLLEHLAHAQAKSARSLQEGALLFIDLDNFKTLNDTYGHETGDLLLRQVAERLNGCVREGDTVARLGGDEFVVMLEDLSTDPKEAAAHAERTAEKILAQLNPPYRIAEQSHHSTPSIGITLFCGHRESLEEVLKRADLAMYQAKGAGRNTLRFFNPEMHSVLARRATLEVDLRQGLLDGQFFLQYQPQVDDNDKVTGAEALLRWRHPQRGLVSPGEFIPVAESSGLILPLGQWVLEAAARQLAVWARHSETSHLSLAVNISARQFRDPHFVEQVLRIIGQTGANPQRLKLEITESLLLDDIGDAVATMTALKSHGVGFSLDDFGTGYSSLSYLKRLPLDQLKIDQSFVRDVLTDPNDAAIARTIVALAQTLGLGVIAEGVETQAQRSFLAEHGCHAFQGYLFGRPGGAEDLLAQSQSMA